MPAGWQSPGQSYSYTYSTKEDLGDIHKVQIVHPGSDQLCIGHIMVDGVEYDENEHRWLDLPHCIEETDGGGCDTVTITLPTNQWSSALTIPCEHADELHASHPPTVGPTTKPTELPTWNPTAVPTPLPTSEPTTSSPTPLPTTSAPTTSAPTTSAPTTSSPTAAAADIDVNLAQIDSEQETQTLHHKTMVLGAVIGAAVTFLLCLCLTALLAVYCWRKRRKMENGVKVIQCASRDVDEAPEDGVVIMSKSPDAIKTEGAATISMASTRDGSVHTGSNGSGKGSYDEIGATPVSAAYDEGDDDAVVVVVEEEVQPDEDDVDAALLVADTGSSDEGIYIPRNAGDTSRRETLDLSQSLDEDVLPKDDDDEPDDRNQEWLE